MFCFGRRCCTALLVFVCFSMLASGAHAQEAIPDPGWLRELLEETRREHHLPAITAAVIVDGKIAAASAVGYRREGSDVRVTRNDPFQLCSVTKSLTATLVAKMVDEGRIRWDMTLAELFPTLVKEMNPAYRDVTIRQLLSHQSGMPYQPTVPQRILDRRAKTTTGRRYQYVLAALKDKPTSVPGTKFLYGGGPILVASALERIMGEPYEALLRRYIFGPLHMTHAGFGDNSSRGKVNGPWEHIVRNGKLMALRPNPRQARQARSPVGKNVHASIIDLARFCVMQLKGDRGESEFLHPATFHELHQAVLPSRTVGMGFFRSSAKWSKGVILTHNGGNTKSCSIYMIAPGLDAGVCVMMNIGTSEACQARNVLCKKLLEMVASGEITPDGRKVPKQSTLRSDPTKNPDG